MLTRITLPEVTLEPGIPGGYGENTLMSRFNLPILAQSPSPESHQGYHGQVNGFMQAVHMAWACHLPLRIRPDDLWLLILQGICIQVNRSPAVYRKQLVYHQDKMALRVQGPLPATQLGQQGWERMIQEHTEMAVANSTPLAGKLLPAFSTTLPADKIAFMGTFLHLVKEFFQYEYTWVCGIPHFDLLGTAEDYKAILEKLDLLKEFDLGPWANEMRPVIQEFIHAKQGNPDLEFWRNVYLRQSKIHLRNAGCDFETIQEQKLKGHFTAFFPFKQVSTDVFAPKYERRLDAEIDFNEIPVGLAKYEVDCVNNEAEQNAPAQFHVYSGFLGCQVCRETYTVSPQIGWVVTRATVPKQKA